MTGEQAIHDLEVIKEDFIRKTHGACPACLDYAIEAIRKQIATEQQGKWDEICEPFGWDDILSARCSVCGESYPYPEDTGFNDIVEMFKYCPNCGAKMEAGDRWKEEEE